MELSVRSVCSPRVPEENVVPLLEPDATSRTRRRPCLFLCTNPPGKAEWFTGI